MIRQVRPIIGLSLLHYSNSRSIRNKKFELFGYLIAENIDIACITETWVSESYFKDNLQEYHLNGYYLFCYQRLNKKGGGVFVYIKEYKTPPERASPTKRYIGTKFCGIKNFVVKIFKKTKQFWASFGLFYFLQKSRRKVLCKFFWL